eukprot:362200-Chlamydomonas_euryale.AAC.17
MRVGVVSAIHCHVAKEALAIWLYTTNNERVPQRVKLVAPVVHDTAQECMHAQEHIKKVLTSCGVS